MLLMQEKVNPDRSDKKGRTASSFAAWNGCEGVGKILLGQEEVNPTGQMITDKHRSRIPPGVGMTLAH